MPGTLRIFSANVQDLPHTIADRQRSEGPYPANRFDCLGRIAGKHDIAVLQEDFTRQRALRHASLTYSWDPDQARSIFRKNSGVSILSRYQMTQLDMQRYDACSGALGASAVFQLGRVFGATIDTFNTKSDCLASKSFKIARIEGITVINSHLDAGRRTGDSDARRAQFEQLDQATPKQGPLVVALDANVHDNNPADREMLARYMRNNNLTLSLRDETDVILTRDVDVTDRRIIPLANLTDHNGLSVTVRVPSPRKPR